jgi:chemotaxis protein MotB
VKLPDLIRIYKEVVIIGSMAVPKKLKTPKEVNTNEWMNTYADTVTLLLCFFVLLYSFSTVSETKWKKIVEAFALENYQVSETQPDVNIDNLDITDLTASETTETTDETADETASESVTGVYKSEEDLLYEKIKDYVYEYDLVSSIEVDHSDGEISIRFKDVVLFDPDSYVLREDSKPILSGLCSLFNDSINLIKMIEIQGHTAASPEGKPEFTQTFEFSTYRAKGVLRYAIDIEGIDSYKLCAAGYGQYHPVGDNDTEEGRAQNRRVEFIIYSTEEAQIIKNITESITETDTVSD